MVFSIKTIPYVQKEELDKDMTQKRHKKDLA